jgi:hypothetical protein
VIALVFGAASGDGGARNGRDPKSIDVLVRVNVARSAAPRAVVDDIRRVAGAVGFGHFFIEQMYTDDTVDQAIASALTLLDCADR